MPNFSNCKTSVSCNPFWHTFAANPRKNTLIQKPRRKVHYQNLVLHIQDAALLWRENDRQRTMPLVLSNMSARPRRRTYSNATWIQIRALREGDRRVWIFMLPVGCFRLQNHIISWSWCTGTHFFRGDANAGSPHQHILKRPNISVQQWPMATGISRNVWKPECHIHTLGKHDEGGFQCKICLEILELSRDSS